MKTTFRNAKLANDPSRTVDIAIADGRIVALGSGLERAEEDFDVGGRLVLPGFVESHIHLDKACILDRCPGGQGPIGDAIAAVSDLKRTFTVDDVKARAERTLAKCVVNGTTRLRTHVEVDPKVGLTGYQGVKAALDAYAWALDGEICVFPQEGLINNPGTEELMVWALEDGAQVVGATPYTDSDPRGQIDRVFALAQRFDADIDMHLDFGADPSQMDIDYVCDWTERVGWGGRVTIGHVTKLSAVSANRFDAVAHRLADAGVAVTVLPATDLFLMGRNRDHDVPRGVVPVHRLLAHDVTCALSTNNVLNPFTPFGDGSLVRMANLYANVCHVGDEPGLAQCLRMISDGAAGLMNLRTYGLAEGMPGDLVVIDSDDPAMAIAELSQPVMGYKNGRRTFTRPTPTLHPPSP